MKKVRKPALKNYCQDAAVGYAITVNVKTQEMKLLPIAEKFVVCILKPHIVEINNMTQEEIRQAFIEKIKNGEIKQKTEDIVGPYELHDFFLYNMVRHNFSPRKIFLLAQKAFAGDYDDETIKKWLTTFCRRFFNQQFKRSCSTDGPKVGSVSLSPRGDWRMPSDASSALWLAECETVDKYPERLEDIDELPF